MTASPKGIPAPPEPEANLGWPPTPTPTAP